MNMTTTAANLSTARPHQESGEIRLVGVTKQFGNSYAVENIDLSIPHGSYCCLLGPSGCGKTTILRMIAGHETPTSGEIYIGDQMVVGKPPVERGTAKMVADAATRPQSTVVPPMRPAIAGGAVRTSWLEVRKIAKTNSFHEKISANTAVAAMPGMSSGSVNRQNAWKRV